MDEAPNIIAIETILPDALLILDCKGFFPSLSHQQLPQGTVARSRIASLVWQVKLRKPKYPRQTLLGVGCNLIPFVGIHCQQVQGKMSFHNDILIQVSRSLFVMYSCFLCRPMDSID